MTQAPRRPVPSPCIGVCALDATQTRCVGCLRTLSEIARWASMSDDERRAVLDALPARRAQPEPR